MKRLILGLVLAAIAAPATAGSPPLILKQGRISQAGPSDTLSVGTNGAVAGKLLDVYQTTTTGSDFSTAYINRTTSHTGGTSGVVNSALLVQDFVGTGVTNFEWGLLSILNNSATGGQNVAIYGQGNKQTISTGPTWGAVFEARETVPVANPTSGLVGIEVDVEGNGSDSHSNRVGIDNICFQFDTGGAANVCGWGYRANNLGANAKFANAFGVGSGAVADVGFDTSQATINIAALRLAQGQAIAFDASSANTLNGDAAGITYKASGSQKIRLNNNGTVQLLVTTVAALPTCASGSDGTLGAVSDATSTTFNAALVGGGTSHVMAYCNGSSWTVH